MFILRNWPAALLVFYWCLMSPLVFACEAILQKDVVQGFVERGLLGSEDTYVQRVYSGDDVSYSTLMFSSTTPFNRKSRYTTNCKKYDINCICSKQILQPTGSKF